MAQTGSGLSIITNENDQSYNSAVYKINIHQKSNVDKLENALNNASKNNDLLQSSLLQVNNSINNLNKQIFINQALIDNWNRNPPYYYNVDIVKI